MDNRFKWNMFITSFIPLWLSVIAADVWNIIEFGIHNWRCSVNVFGNLNVICRGNIICICVVVVTTVMMTISICSLNGFLKDKCSNKEAPKIMIKKALKANKLSSEFLLAYILPMIAFDFTKLKSIVLFIIYFVTLAFLCIRNSNVYTNIWLEIKGYKMFLCDLETYVMGRPHTYEECLVISKNNLIVNIDNYMTYWDFDNCIYIDLE